MKVQEIAKVLSDFKLKKSRGQNFLLNKNIARRMVEALDIKSGENVVEIGSGLGSLTEILIEKGIKPVCVEIEERFCEYLNSKFYDKITLLNRDFLNLKEKDLGYPKKIIGSLPYRGAKKIISYILLNFKNIKRCVFLLQKEVADSIISRCNSKDYGPLSVISHLRCDLKKIMNVPPDSFYPRPKVQSEVILMEFKRGIINGNFYHFLRIIFKQRRKTISNNLKGIINVGIKKRAEELKPEEIYELYNTYSVAVSSGK